MALNGIHTFKETHHGIYTEQGRGNLINGGQSGKDTGFEAESPASNSGLAL